MSVTKRFDRQLFNENDALARNAVKDLFNEFKYDIRDNEKRLGVDLQVFDKKSEKHLFNVETEVKKFAWTPGKFKYDTVQLPERKRKYCELETPTLFIVWNIDQTAYLAFWSKDVLKSKLVEVPNRYNYKDEHFFQIPIDKCLENVYSIKQSIKENL